VEEEVDRCVECGFCEPVCPSRDLTTTPRQRIVLRREIERARRAGDTATLDQLESEYEYDAVQTCAVDGMCQTACPVTINTGDLMKRLRAEHAGRVASTGWAAAARHWDVTTRAAATALTTAAKLPERLVLHANELVRKAGRADSVPLWSAELPHGGRRRQEIANRQAEAVLFASCTATMFGSTGAGAAEAFRMLCDRAGIRLATPEGVASLCCGTPWKSKGMARGYEEISRRVLPALWTATDGGRIPAVGDASSCTEGLQNMIAQGPERFHAIQVVDAVEFVRAEVLPHLTITAPAAVVALHPTCSATRMGLTGVLRELTAAVATTVTVPDEWGCCGFAGDRGLLHPELTASATARQARELAAGGSFDAHVSCNRTCELGMTRATGQTYEHVLELIERATRPAEGAW
jgi:D-lactate dehydrogenase